MSAQQEAKDEAWRRYANRSELALSPAAIRNGRMEAFERGAAFGWSAAIDAAAHKVEWMAPHAVTVRDAVAAIRALDATPKEEGQ